MSDTRRKIRHALAPYVKTVLRVPADALVLSSRELNRRVNDCISQTSAFMENASLSAKFFPYEGTSETFMLRAPEETSDLDDGLPVPPPELFEGYGPRDRYLSSGRRDFDSMMSIVGRSGFRLAPGMRVLDFGCAAGRLIRHLAAHAASCEIRGVDIKARYMSWCQQNLTPFRFSTSTTFPHLPFEDGYFDLVYSGSVFTHISDLADAWFLELRRILKPGGRLYLTVHDDAAVRCLREKHPDYFLTRLLDEYDRRTPIYSRPYDMFTLRRSPQDAMVFYGANWLQRTWGREMRWLSHTPEAYGYQSAVLLEK